MKHILKIAARLAVGLSIVVLFIAIFLGLVVVLTYVINNIPLVAGAFLVLFGIIALYLLFMAAYEIGKDILK